MINFFHKYSSSKDELRCGDNISATCYTSARGISGLLQFHIGGLIVVSEIIKVVFRKRWGKKIEEERRLNEVRCL